jgi:hypothetical protein
MLQDGFDFDRKALNGFSKLAEQVESAIFMPKLFNFWRNVLHKI